MTEPKDNISSQYLILNIGAHSFAVPVMNIQDVIKSINKTPVPLSKANINGLLNLRGHIVTEIDVAKTLGIEGRKHDSKNDFAVVVDIKDEFYSFAFDGIGDVIEIKNTSIDPMPETVQKSWHKVSKGVHKLSDKLLVMLDLNLIVSLISDDKEPSIAIA